MPDEAPVMKIRGIGYFTREMKTTNATVTSANRNAGMPAFLLVTIITCYFAGAADFFASALAGDAGAAAGATAADFNVARAWPTS